ncbi:hypothetical protein C8A01DRAFT_21121 [Parachaetomium inaequale]|uniref:Uncharacterized protein n=1 Tax=Parachaetomium inaequale TaxID=2588326 RepID=A0AAN6P4R1_9PEZI|nr:hypothetical protein C8A01DRAFT_21121 [Parachaetomium inaequale]
MFHADFEGSKAMHLDLRAVGHERYVEYEAPRLDADAICATLNCHQSYELQAGYVIHDLPCYGAFAFYGDMTEAEELALCEREARRLVRIANTNSPVELQGSEDMFGPATQEGYLRLHRLGRKLIRSFQICQHDAAVAETENMGNDRSYKRCADLQSRLLSNFDISTGEERFTGFRSAADGDVDRCYHAVVNYMTAVLVRIILQTVRGEYWVNHLVAVVARLAAKVKVIGTDLPRSVELSLQKATDARIRIHQRATRDGRYAITRPAWYGGDEAIIKNRIHAQVGEAVKYFVEMDTLYNSTVPILISSLSDFAVSNPMAPATDDFESSVAMYESFVTAEQVLLCQQRDGGIGAASEVGTTRAFTGGFQVCLQVWENLAEKPVDSKTTSWTSIQWKWSRVDETTGALMPENRQGTVKLSSMKSVIAATVPYSLISGSSTAAFSGLIDMMNFDSGRYHKSSLLLIKQPSVLCTAIVRTSTYESRRPDSVVDRDAYPVSETFLLQKRAVVNVSTGVDSKNAALAPMLRRTRRENEITLRDRDTTKEALESVLKKFNTWVLDDNFIIVPYKKYAWGSMAISALLVIGGLVVGFVVGERINGVDPFNISMFCWALAAFLLLVAKAIRVENWPWSSFLRGECPCRSVSEVVAVTGVNPQVLLAILLRLDNRIYLRTRGPFNCFFRRRSDDAGGFSIDVPIRCSTAMEGGLIPIKVLTDWGPRLVFVYTHSWATYNVAEHSSSHSGRVYCPDVTHPSSWEGDLPCYRLSVMEEDDTVITARVLGVFERDCYFC